MGVNKLIDETGNVYGKLTVVERTKVNGQTTWLCNCSCGGVTYAQGGRLRKGDRTSCGCAISEREKKLGKMGIITGESESREGRIHSKMLERCYTKDSPSYDYYGAIGITVCERWLGKHEGLLNFIEDMGRAPDGMWLERIDNSGNYCKENCKWETVSNQQFNRKRFSTNRTGVTGIKLTPQNTYEANIQCNGRRYFKNFKNFEDAVKWRTEKELELFGKNKPEHRKTNDTE